MNNSFRTIPFYLLLFAGTACYCQTPQQNLDKYWSYRARFYDKFIVDIDPFSLPAGAPTNGINLPACIYNATTDGTRDNTISWGDAPITLSEYISMLATEYKLQQLNNLNVSSIKTKIFRALNAFNRIDASAEPIYGCGGSLGSPPCYTYTDINGFFIRDDVDLPFMSYWSSNGMSSWQAPDIKKVHSSYNSYLNGGGEMHGEMSQDQVWNMLMGLALVKEFVDATDTYEDFPCDYVTLKDMAKRQTYRPINYMQTYMSSLPWTRKPRGDSDYPGKWIPIGPLPLQVWMIKNTCTNNEVAMGGGLEDLYFFHTHFEDAGNWITEQDFGNLNYLIAPALLVGLPQDPVLPIPVTNNWYNNVGKLIMSTIADNIHSSSLDKLFFNIRKCADYFNHDNSVSGNPYDIKYFWLDQLPMLSVLLHDKEPIYPIFDYYYSHIEQLLNEAPLSGPSCYANDPSILWSTPSILAKPIGEVYNNPRNDLFGEYSGLDYMLLFNLYHLIYETCFNDPVTITNDFPITYAYGDSYDYEYGTEHFEIGHMNNAACLTIHSKDLITMNSTVNSTGKLRLMGNEILLQAGFEVELGGEFTAELNDIMDLDFTPPAGTAKSAQAGAISSFETEDEELVTAIEPVETATLDQFIVYPNPADMLLNVKLVAESSEIVLYNSGGAIMQQFSNVGDGVLHIDISNYPSGLYIITVTAEDGNVAVKKVVVE